LEVIFNVILPVSRSGLVAGYILALGRALGETMAVTMLIGNANLIPKGIFSPGNTMASVIANQFGEADGLKLSALIAIGLLLFVVTAIVNAAGKWIVRRYA
ncbi:MAG: ABC transporter permease subunit, partial [Prolixibacteraceae bacterium]